MLTVNSLLCLSTQGYPENKFTVEPKDPRKRGQETGTGFPITSSKDFLSTIPV